ncbi:hypothetical protein CEXT_684681 [Caerostris extrusa]|uniref:Uncharacterized protein n=1 Tax=Caerostris extrusa TaxID=172846 RepID=A0AAV4XID0_CAEEX|nr:hypothetical protein CEXT_684681 [Caerostris extrusa]
MNAQFLYGFLSAQPRNGFIYYDKYPSLAQSTYPSPKASPSPKYLIPLLSPYGEYPPNMPFKQPALLLIHQLKTQQLQAFLMDCLHQGFNGC